MSSTKVIRSSIKNTHAIISLGAYAIKWAYLIVLKILNYREKQKIKFLSEKSMQMIEFQGHPWKLFNCM